MRASIKERGRVASGQWAVGSGQHNAFPFILPPLSVAGNNALGNISPHNAGGGGDTPPFVRSPVWYLFSQLFFYIYLLWFVSLKGYNIIVLRSK